MKKTIDARGLSCPQPVILTRNVIKDMKKGDVSVLVDTMTQVYNVTRSAERLGWTAGFQKKDDEYIVTLNR